MVISYKDSWFLNASGRQLVLSTPPLPVLVFLFCLFFLLLVFGQETGHVRHLRRWGGLKGRYSSRSSSCWFFVKWIFWIRWIRLIYIYELWYSYLPLLTCRHAAILLVLGMPWITTGTRLFLCLLRRISLSSERKVNMGPIDMGSA